jgi:hypothetical protein
MPTYFNPNAFGDEDVDHINISNQSKTQIGLLLDPSYFKVIDYPCIGKFGSVMNLWYWLKTSPLDDSLRRVTGFRLKSKLATINTKHKVPNFRAIVATATYLKLKQYPHILRQLKALPKEVSFISYYVPKGTGLRMCSNYAAIITEIVVIIKDALDREEEPDFGCLINESDAVGYFYLEPFLVAHFGVDRLREFDVLAPQV